MRQVLLLQNNTHSEALRDGLEVRILVPLPPSLYMSRLIIYDTVPRQACVCYLVLVYVQNIKIPAFIIFHLIYFKTLFKSPLKNANQILQEIHFVLCHNLPSSIYTFIKYANKCLDNVAIHIVTNKI